MGALGAGLVATFVIIAILAPLLAPYDPDAINLRAVAKAPSWIHWFGTDPLGRDLLSRILYGARTSLVLGFCVVVIAGTAGLLIGAAGGYFGGVMDRALLLVVDVLMTMPAIITALAVITILGPGLSSTTIAIAIAGAPRLARTSRGVVLQIRNLDYIESARALGISDAMIVLRHIMPNALAPIIVEASLLMSDAVLVAAGLGFLGLGVPPPAPEWGQMVADGRTYLTSAPFIPLTPGFAIILLALGFNLLGDGLRHALDVRR